MNEVLNQYKYTCWKTTSEATCSVVTEITNKVMTNNEINPTRIKAKYHGYLSATYEDTYTNTQDSEIKKNIDKWYEENLLNKTDETGTSFADYLADSSFCGDRSIASGDGNTLNDFTYYGAFKRIYQSNTPSLICPRREDKYTISSEKGNGKLKYPIALITADEVAIAGGKYTNMNTSYYLYTGASFWTMTPSLFSTNVIAWVSYINPKGSLDVYGSVLNTATVRPVINLKANTMIKTGDGSAEYPFEVTVSK